MVRASSGGKRNAGAKSHGSIAVAVFGEYRPFSVLAQIQIRNVLVSNSQTTTTSVLEKPTPVTLVGVTGERRQKLARTAIPQLDGPVPARRRDFAGSFDEKARALTWSACPCQRGPPKRSAATSQIIRFTIVASPGQEFPRRAKTPPGKRAPGCTGRTPRSFLAATSKCECSVAAARGQRQPIGRERQAQDFRGVPAQHASSLDWATSHNLMVLSLPGRSQHLAIGRKTPGRGPLQNARADGQARSGRQNAKS